MATNSAELKQAALPFAILAEEMAALERFHECAADGEGYDVPKAMMKRLEEIGLVRRRSGSYYEETIFGISVLNGDFAGRTAAQGESKVRYMSAGGVTAEQRSHARRSELHKHGDMILVWVNEGDILFHDRFPDPSPDQAGSAEQVSETQLAIEMARVAHNHVENGEMRHDVGIALLDVVRKHAAPERKVMTDQEIRNLAYSCGFQNKWNRPGYGPDLHDYVFAFARDLLNQQGEQTAQEWQPIETAPKDGTPILLGRAESEFHTAESTVGWWQEAVEDGVDYMGGDAGFVDFAFQVFNPGRSFGSPSHMYAADQPTHWMPLPAAPSTAQKDGGRE